MNKVKNKTMHCLNVKTHLMNQQIINAGYKLEYIWECEFKRYNIVLNNKDEFVSRLKPRDSFYGGRTDPTKLIYNFKENTIKGRYVDYVSLYPTVNRYDFYPIGHL